MIFGRNNYPRLNYVEARFLEIPPERHADSAIGGIGFPMGTARLFA